jgi:hypothetical protein
MKTILIIVDYFGKWPKWFDMYLKSCELNPTIHFRVHTDCPVPVDSPANVTFVPISETLPDFVIPLEIIDRLNVSRSSRAKTSTRINTGLFHDASLDCVCSRKGPCVPWDAAGCLAGVHVTVSH